jgi:hypothetical protein
MRRPICEFRDLIESDSGLSPVLLDEVCVYNRALTEGEIKTAMEQKTRALSVKPRGTLTTTWGETKHTSAKSDAYSSVAGILNTDGKIALSYLLKPLTVGIH